MANQIAISFSDLPHLLRNADCINDDSCVAFGRTEPTQKTPEFISHPSAVGFTIHSLSETLHFTAFREFTPSFFRGDLQEHVLGLECMHVVKFRT